MAKNNNTKIEENNKSFLTIFISISLLLLILVIVLDTGFLPEQRENIRISFEKECREHCSKLNESVISMTYQQDRKNCECETKIYNYVTNNNNSSFEIP